MHFFRKNKSRTLKGVFSNQLYFQKSRLTSAKAENFRNLFDSRLLFSIVVLCNLSFTYLFANDNEIAEKIWRLSQNDLTSEPKKGSAEANSKVIKLSIEDAVKFVIENNITVKNAKYEIIKADSDLLKNESKFLWKALGTVESFRTTLPNNRLNVFTGTKQSNDKIAAGIEKQFLTGTYFKLEASAVRFDSNSFESSNSGDFKILALPPLYTGAVSVTLSQELLKSSFGKTEKNQIKILENQTAIKREEMVYQLSGLIVQVLVDYWSLTIYDSAVLTYEKLLKNTKEIRDLTTRKQSYGLAERFEVSQWNSALSGVKNQLEKTKLNREETKRKLLRILNVDPTSEISGLTDLTENSSILKKSFEEDLDYAYANRIDLRNAIREKEISNLSLSNAEKEDIPSLKISGTYSSRAQNLISPQENFVNSDHGILSMKYPEYRGDVKLSYPLWDKGIKSNIRDAILFQKQAKLKEEKIKNEIFDELKTRREALATGYEVLQKSKKTEEEMEKFYNGVIGQFRQGKYPAIAVKNALDAYVQSQLGTVQARVNYNINILRYDLTKNFIFEKYGVDIAKVISEIK